jgi:dihydroorotase
MSLLIKNGRVIDPANNVDDVLDILISGGKIEKAGKNLTDKSAEVIDASGKIVAPGFVDMHAHLREPGREDEETVATGTRAAIRGGYTSIVCMPNTEPAIDRPEVARAVKDIIKKDASCNVYVAGAITQNREGKALSDIEGMKKEGVVAITDDGSCVGDKNMMMDALRAAKKAGLLVMDHCEDPKLSRQGVMNRGFAATKTGLRGIPREAEYEMVKRDIELAKKLGARIHIAHVSCAESVELIRQAKRDRIAITAETAPHYFSLTEECCASYDTNTKMNPPLRSSGDVGAIKRGLADGTIDAIATDHAPHTDSEKDVEFDLAPFGIIGLETALGLAVTELVDKNILSWPQLITRMSAAPARILGIAAGSLKSGSPADIVVIDPDKKYVYKKEAVESKSRNSPFINWELKAGILIMFVKGVRPLVGQKGSDPF